MIAPHRAWRRGHGNSEAEHLTARVMSLYQPIAVEQDTVTFRERPLALHSSSPASSRVASPCS